MSKQPLRKVFIVEPDPGYSQMFHNLGWATTDSLEDCDLIQFTGGADVDPSLYGEEAHDRTFYTPSRDKKELLIFNWGLFNNKPMAGICRGGQFLNVMCGGKMWQDVDGHIGPHKAIDMETGEEFQVSSTHHQMMIPHKDKGQVIVIAQEATAKEKMIQGSPLIVKNSGDPDVEAVFYPVNRCFCFQPHPEFSTYKGLAERYHNYLLTKLFATA